MPYTLYCAIIGHKKVITLDVNETWTVGQLQNHIKAENAHALAPYDAASLVLYRVNINITEKDIRKEVMQQIHQSSISFDREEAMDPVDHVSEYWESSKFSELPKKTIHILVELPQGESIDSTDPEVCCVAETSPISSAMPTADEKLKRKEMDDDGVGNLSSINPALLFTSQKKGTDHFNQDTLATNHIAHETSRIPEFILAIREKLRAKRLISTELQALFRVFLRGNYAGSFDVVDRDTPINCSHEELTYYASLVRDQLRPSIFSTAPPKHTVGIWYFRDIAMHLYSKYYEVGLERESHWSFKFVGQVVGGRSYSYQPKSDYMFLLDSYPLIMIEVISNPNESDRYRMLLQGGLLVRVMNSIKRTQTQSFVSMAIYIHKPLVAVRYLIYQPDFKNKEIKYIMDEFDLNTPSGAFRFFFELHNLPSALPRDDELSDAKTHLSTLKEEVDREKLGGFTTREPKRPKPNPPNDDNNNNIFGNTSIAQQVSSAGYQLLLDEPVEGWTLLNPLPPTLSRARRSTGEVVILKLVDQDEFAIHSFLSSLKAPQNHTIPILDVIPLSVGKLVVMPQEQALSNVRDFATGNSLASQFVEGVRFLHEQNVAHLDLKPDNIVITAAMRLRIIDFGVSVRVPNLESWIEGYRGTKGWAAPELENDPDAEYQPIRADLWSAGRVLRFFSQRVSGKFEFAFLVGALLEHNPQQRPYLSEISQDALMVKPKRKRDVDVLKVEMAKRQRVQPRDPSPRVGCLVPV